MTRRAPLVVALSLAACGAATPVAAPPDASAVDAVAAPDIGAPGDAAAVDAASAPDVVDVPVAADASFAQVAPVSDAPEREFSEPDAVLDPAMDYRAVIETDVGRLVLDLYEARAPLAVNSFVFLALHRYFDGLAFHRVIEGFVAQGGDPLTATTNRARWGTGGPGYSFDTETAADLRFDAAGTLGMARSTARDSNGSQFFITLAATPNLDGQYTVFGRVTEGADALPRIARNATATAPPTTPTRMTRVTIEARPR